MSSSSVSLSDASSRRPRMAFSSTDQRRPLERRSTSQMPTWLAASARRSRSSLWASAWSAVTLSWMSVTTPTHSISVPASSWMGTTLSSTQRYVPLWCRRRYSHWCFSPRAHPFRLLASTLSLSSGWTDASHTCRPQRDSARPVKSSQPCSVTDCCCASACQTISEVARMMASVRRSACRSFACSARISPPERRRSDTSRETTRIWGDPAVGSRNRGDDAFPPFRRPLGGRQVALASPDPARPRPWRPPRAPRPAPRQPRR